MSLSVVNEIAFTKALLFQRSDYYDEFHPQQSLHSGKRLSSGDERA